MNHLVVFPTLVFYLVERFSYSFLNLLLLYVWNTKAKVMERAIVSIRQMEKNREDLGIQQNFKILEEKDLPFCLVSRLILRHLK